MVTLSLASYHSAGRIHLCDLNIHSNKFVLPWDDHHAAVTGMDGTAVSYVSYDALEESVSTRVLYTHGSS